MRLIFCFGLVCLILGTACTPSRGIQTFKLISASELALLGTPSDKYRDVLNPDDYKLNISDELDIKIEGHDDFNQTVKVRPDGQITLPLIGDIKAKSKSTDELKAEITRRYRLLSMPEVDSSATAHKEYLITVNDELALKFPYHNNMDQTVKVRPDGRISLSMIGSVVAEGRTPSFLNKDINRRYQKYLKKPNATLIVNQFSTMRYRLSDNPKIAGLENVRASVIVKATEGLEVFVGGNVLKPGVIHYRKTLTAMTAIIEAGGGVAGAKMGNVVVVREHAGQPFVATLDLASEFLPEQPTHDVALRPHDIIIVPNTKIDRIGDFMEDLVRVIPPIQNSTFAFFYGL
ncbi:MAG: polysaccharide biosynthesis/export family protein [Methylococcaceae bacterium]|nr:polysaccharide biosynthesis/export family protein [Methylococcaceae bacterium]